MPGDKPYTPQEAMKQALDKSESPEDALTILEQHGYKLTKVGGEEKEEGEEDGGPPKPFGLEAFRKKAVDKAMPDDDGGNPFGGG